MRNESRITLFIFALMGVLVSTSPALAHVELGTGNASLVGGDLADPENDVVDRGSYGHDLSEAELRPEKGNWVAMKSFPNNPPGTPAHQRHAYQSWLDNPACAIFLNRPEQRKWYVSFRDGGYGGPNEESPYYAAIQFDTPIALTHFTLTTASDMPGRDPRVWAIQGSNSGEDHDWTDVYRVDATGRSSSPLAETPRCQTRLFTSFTSAGLAKAGKSPSARRLASRLQGKTILKPDFARPTGAYTWYRIAVYACFNPSSAGGGANGQAPGFSIGQLELYGVPGKAAPPKAAPEEIAPVGIEPVPSPFDPGFIISFWCAPTKEETTLARYQEIADCGMNVAFVPCDASDESQKRLDLCQKVGIKAMIGIDLPHDASGDPSPAEIAEIHKSLDATMAKFAKHPALHSYVLGDEPTRDKFARLAVINQYLLKKDPGHLPYINLLPNYAGHPDWNGPAYEESVRMYIDQVKPQLVSWDHYRQVFEGGDESYYWENLEIMRKLCRKANLPLIQIICSLKHMGYRESSEADMRWQVYTSLAYGSHGIIYFTYWDVPGLAWADAPALITMDGKRDVKWTYVQDINRRITNLAPTLMKITSTGVYHTDPIPQGGRRLPRGTSVKKAEGGTLAIGCFVDRDAQEYVMVVNRSFHNSCVAKLTLHDKIVAAAEVSQDNGKLNAAENVAQTALDIPLLPGEGRLYRLKRSNK